MGARSVNRADALQANEARYINANDCWVSNMEAASGVPPGGVESRWWLD